MGDEQDAGHDITIGLLAERPELIPVIGEIRWREWGYEPEPIDLASWVEITRAETGVDRLPVTWVATDRNGEAIGAVALGEFEIEERRDVSPWVMGMIVRADLRGRGIGRLLLGRLSAWAVTAGYTRLWVATEPTAVGFYQSCGWQVVEVFQRPAYGEPTIVLNRDHL